MVRKDNWPLLFSEYLKEKYNSPFRWGVNDCLSFVAGAIQVITGEDLYKKYKGYKTEEGALAKMNGKTVENIIAENFGGGHRNILQAKRGDIVLVKMPEFMAGIVDDSGQRIALVSKKGLIRIPLEKAWRIWSY